MKTTFSTLILATFLMGFFLVGNAIAQDSDGGPTAAEVDLASTAPEATPEPSETASEPVTTGSESTAPTKPVDQGKGLYDSVKGGEWLLAFGFLGMLLGSIARFIIGRKWDFIKTKTGGYIISAGVGLGTLGTLIIEADGFSMSMLSPAILATTAAMALHGPAKGLKKKLVGETPQA